MYIRSCAVLLLIISSAAVFAADQPRVFQAAEISAASEEIAAEGAAWLKRSKGRVDGRVMAKVDKADTPYSIWWVIFNNPGGCVDGCGEDDVFNETGGLAAGVAIFNASGAISAASGGVGGVINADLSAIAGEGAGKGSQNGPVPAPFFSRVLEKNNGLCAEIHIDINEHEKNDAWVAELTYPENPQAFAVFPPVQTGSKCRRHDDDDD